MGMANPFTAVDVDSGKTALRLGKSGRKGFENHGSASRSGSGIRFAYMAYDDQWWGFREGNWVYAEVTVTCTVW
jgi:hypothetical protein